MAFSWRTQRMLLAARSAAALKQGESGLLDGTRLRGVATQQAAAAAAVPCTLRAGGGLQCALASSAQHGRTLIVAAPARSQS